MFRQKKQGVANDITGTLFTLFDLLTSDKINT